VTTFNVIFSQSWLTKGRRLSAIALLLIGCLLTAAPAQAHHAFGGQRPDSFLTGFLGGMAHPVIGLDHFVFVVAAGLLAALQCRGILIPVAFVLASLAGTGVHLMRLDLPAPELIISASVLIFGVLLASKNHLNTAIVIGLGAIAGIFHGYAYGEAIVGAEMTPLLAYLAGFALIQLIISLLAYLLGQRMLKNATVETLPLRFAGFTICGVGIALLNSIITG
jgi:urease accessory protein